MLTHEGNNILRNRTRPIPGRMHGSNKHAVVTTESEDGLGLEGSSFFFHENKENGAWDG